MPNSMFVKATLIKLGYDARGNYGGGSFDIHQGTKVHLLSAQEGESLMGAQLAHPVDLMDYATRGGLNYWYDFAPATTA